MHRFLRGTTWLPGSKSFPSQNTEKSWDPISSQFKPKGGEFPGLWAKSQAHRVSRRRGGADNWDNARAMAKRQGWAPASKGGCILGLCYWRHVWRSLAGATRGWARFGLSRRKRNLMLSSRSSSKLLTCRNNVLNFHVVGRLQKLTQNCLQATVFHHRQGSVDYSTVNPSLPAG